MGTGKRHFSPGRGPLIEGSMIDITARKHGEEELQKAKEAAGVRQPRQERIPGKYEP